MRTVIVGLWAVLVTLGASYAVAQMKIATPDAETAPASDGISYVSLPTLSVPVVEAGRLSGYVVVRLVYTADGTVLHNLAAQPDAFVADEIFRRLYGNAKTRLGSLVRLDLKGLASGARAAVNERLGDDVVQDILFDGLNYIDLARRTASASQRAAATPGIRFGDGEDHSFPANTLIQPPEDAAAE